MDLRAGNIVRIVAIVLTFAFVASAAILSARATTYTVSVTTDKPSYYADNSIMITGTVTPAPAPNTTSAFVTVMNPNGKVVAPSPAQVGNNGAFHYTFGAGGTANWISGTYTVNASWSGSIGTKPIWSTTTFIYAPLASTTTTSPTTTSSTTTITSTTSTSTTSTTTTSSTSTSSSTTPTATSSTSTSTTSSSAILSTTSATAPSGGGGIPEFPFQLGITLVVTVAIVLSYAAARRVGHPK